MLKNPTQIQYIIFHALIFILRIFLMRELSFLAEIDISTCILLVCFFILFFKCTMN